MKYERTTPDVFLTKASNANDCHWYYVAKSSFYFSPAFASISSHALVVAPPLCSTRRPKCPEFNLFNYLKTCNPFWRQRRMIYMVWSDQSHKIFSKIVKIPFNGFELRSPLRIWASLSTGLVLVWPWQCPTRLWATRLRTIQLYQAWSAPVWPRPRPTRW